MAGQGSPPGKDAAAPSGDGELRCFVGFELTRESRAYLRERVEALHGELGRLRQPGPRIAVPKIVPAENWHATLLFFPRLTRAERDVVWQAVERGVAEGAWRDLRFAWQRLALWPSPRRPNLVCAEAEPHEDATAWPLLNSLAQAPFNRADTRHAGHYVPHVTVMRFRRGRGARPGPVWEVLPEDRLALDRECIRFDRVSFFLSTVSAQAPIYPRERTLPLEG